MEKRKIFKIAIIILIIVAIIAVATILTFYFIKKSKFEYEIEQVEEYNYSIFYRDNKYGVINKEGEIIIEPTYTNVQIPNPSKPLFICMGEYNQELGEYENKVLKLTEGNYILSTKELNTSRNISALLNSSITSFKVEGRMKSPDYVAFITRFYRTLIDNFLINHSKKITEEDTKKLKTLFNRGFTNGYLFKEPNIMNFKTPNHQGIPIGKVLSWNTQKIKILLEEDLTQGDGIRFKEIKSGMIVNFLYDETMKLIHEAKKGSVIYVDNKVELHQKGTVLKTYDTCLTKEIEEYPSKKIPIQMIIKITEKTFSLEISDFKNTLTVNKEICEKAKTCSTTKETVLKQCDRLKDTPFFLQDIKIELPENVFIPVSKINEIRREAVANLITLRSK